MTKNKFRGPIIIVGMPRSGTKLLRGLLNTKDIIKIPSDEINFLAYWLERWDSFGDLSIYSNFCKFYKLNKLFPYFDYNNEVNILTECREWYNRCVNFNIDGILEGLLKYNMGLENNYEYIWGGKSPAIITQLQSLKEKIPEAKVIHIVRDVRDYCLSNFKAWKKDKYESAVKWNRSILSVNSQMSKYKKDYYVIKYEDLLDNTESSMKSISKFLNIEFSEEFLKLEESTESIGNLKGIKKVQMKNYSKYLNEMTKYEIQIIDQICSESMCLYGYEPINNTIIKREYFKSKTTKKILNLINYFIFKIRKRGIFNAIKQTFIVNIIVKIPYKYIKPLL